MIRLLLALLTLCLSLASAQRLGPLPPGADGWLFHQDEYGFYTQDDARSTQKALDHIVTVSRLLEAQGIRVVIAMTPAKIGLYEDKLPAGYPLSESLRSRYDTAVRSLREAGLTVPDVKSAFAASDALGGDYPLFQRLDHHWSSLGALEAARSVAAAMNEDLEGVLASIPTVEYDLSEAGEAVYSGSSLLALADDALKDELQASGYAPEAYKKFAFERLTPATGGLFGDATPEIVLVGASFSQGETASAWPFASALQYALSKEVLNVAQVGKGAWEPMSDYLQDESFAVSPPKIIIWEIWELFLEAFGQANLGPDWLMNTAAQLSTCDEALATLDKMRSNGLFNAAGGLKLLQTEADTYLEYVLDTPPGINDSFRVSARFGSAESSRLRLEVRGEGWTRELDYPIQLGRDQQLSIPLYPQGARPATSVRLYPGASEAFSLGNAARCQLPDFVAETLMTPLELSEANLGVTEIPGTILLSGLRGVDPSGRWALGPTSELGFFLAEDRALELALAFSSPVASQGVHLSLNGETLERFSDLPEGELVKRTYPLGAKAGFNRLELAFDDWNGHKRQFDEDPTPFAVYLSDLALFEPGQAVFRDAPTPVQPDLAALPTLHDLVLAEAPEGLELSNFSKVEAGGFRWALGPESSLKLTTPEAQRLTFDLRFFNPIAGQSVEARFNGELLETLRDLPEGAVLERSYTVDTQAGENLFSLNFADWNEGNVTFAPGDPRPMAVMFSRFQTYEGEARTVTRPDPVALEPVVSRDLAPALVTEPAPPAEPIPALTSAPAQVQRPVIQTVDFTEGDLIATSAPQTLRLNGLDPVEDSTYRWALGPQTSVDFKSERAQSVEVALTFINPIEDQSVTIRFNGSVLQELARIDQGSEISLKFRVNAIPGNNRLSFDFSDWNGGNVTFAPGDTRPMAVLFKTLDLRKGS